MLKLLVTASKENQLALLLVGCEVSYLIVWLKLFSCSDLSPPRVYLFSRSKEYKMTFYASVV